MKVLWRMALPADSCVTDLRAAYASASRLPGYRMLCKAPRVVPWAFPEPRFWARLCRERQFLLRKYKQPHTRSRGHRPPSRGSRRERGAVLCGIRGAEVIGRPREALGERERERGAVLCGIRGAEVIARPREALGEREEWFSVAYEEQRS